VTGEHFGVDNPRRAIPANRVEDGPLCISYVSAKYDGDDESM
jgi:hypothetical protein